MSQRRIIFVGQAPGRSGNPDEPLSGTVGRKLSDMLGVSYSDFMRFSRENLNYEFSSKSGKGDRFDATVGKFKAEQIEKVELDIVVLGEKVARCFRLGWCPLGYIRFGACRFLMLPHPSGINRWYNSARNRTAARRSFKRFINENES